MNSLFLPDFLPFLQILSIFTLFANLQGHSPTFCYQSFIHEFNAYVLYGRFYVTRNFMVGALLYPLLPLLCHQEMCTVHNGKYSYF